MIYDIYCPRFWEFLEKFPPPHILRHFNDQDRRHLDPDFPDV
jgi:hypothetical protein